MPCDNCGLHGYGHCAVTQRQRSCMKCWIDCDGDDRWPASLQATLLTMKAPVGPGPRMTAKGCTGGGRLPDYPLQCCPSAHPAAACLALL